MKQSQLNRAYRAADAFFRANGWVTLPHFQWDITDFGLGEFDTCGLVLINLAEELEYCEKLMYAAKNQKTPAHYHRRKKEDIICRTGVLAIRLWPTSSASSSVTDFGLKVNGSWRAIKPSDTILLQTGERVTIPPGIWHEFWPESDECIIGEVSTANDDVTDNFFMDERIGRYPEIDADEIPLIGLVGASPLSTHATTLSYT